MFMPEYNIHGDKQRLTNTWMLLRDSTT